MHQLFDVQELQLGRRKFRSGSSGVVHVVGDPRMGMPAVTKPRHETSLSAKIMFGNKRFSFEVMELDRSPQSIAKLVKKKGREGFVPSSWDMILATLNCPVQSFQVKFEDIVSLECRSTGEEWELVLNLKKPVSCYAKSPSSNWKTVESPLANCKTIRCVTAAPSDPSDPSARRGSASTRFETLP